MPIQKKIGSFFKPMPMKRPSEELTQECKKPKLEIKSESNCKTESQCALDIPEKKFIGESWLKILNQEFEKPYYKKLQKFVGEERSRYTVYPTAENVWTWTQMCPLNKIKVIILGQDPYFNPGQAHGLCFSVPKNIPPPPSLLNMYKELESDIPNFEKPNHGNLTGWAKQGVLLLNACLTVRSGSANSHKDQGWEQITDAVIKYLNSNFKGLVFLLWGSYSQKKAAFVDNKKHLVLKSVHPSPLSAHRGFLGCRHFSQCNKYLEEIGKTTIDWGDLTLD